MAFIEIHGPCRIQGGLTVQGSKNAVLPMMAASVLNRGVLRFYGMLPSFRCIIFLKRQCKDCLFNIFKLVSYILDILFPAGTNSSRRASPSSISLRALHNGVKRGDGEGAAAAPSFKDDLGNVALGKEFL